MQKITFILFLVFYGFGFAQHSDTDICNLNNDNRAWFLEMRKTNDLPTQVDLTVNKLVADAQYLGVNNESADLGEQAVFEVNNCNTNCSIRFVLIYAKSKGLVLDLKKNPELEELILQFNASNIDRIELNEYYEKDIYKANVKKRSGVVIYTEDKEIKKLVKKALKDIAS